MEKEIKKRDIVEVETSAKNLEKDECDYKYTAFISYRHLEPDIRVAKAVHRAIETFKLPKEFYEGGKRPSFRVFRDREELTTTSLSDSIQEALESSKYLIVICSKRLRESKWCNIEVETFIGLHGVERVIPVLIEGEPEDSFPKALIHDWEDKEIEEDGTVEVQDSDILAAELRSEEVLDPNFIGFEALNEKDPSKVKELGDKAVKLLKTEKFRIMAAILGVSYGDLKNRDKARRQKTLLGISALVSAALLFFGIFMVSAYRNENAAKRVTLQDKSAFMLDEAENLLSGGDRLLALSTATKAMEELDDKMERYEALKHRHQYLLQSGLSARRSSFNSIINTGNQFSFVDIKENTQELLVGLGNDEVGVFDLKTGEELKRLSGHTQQVKLLSLNEEETRLLSGGFDGKVILWDATNYEKLKEMETPGNIMLLQWGLNNRVDVIYDTIDAYYYEAFDGNTLEPLSEPLLLEPGIKRIGFSGDGKRMFLLKETFQENNSLFIYDLETGQHHALEDLTRESEDGEYTVVYRDITMSKDQSQVYALSPGILSKIDATSGNILWENRDFSGIGDNLMLLEGETLFVADGSTLLKLDKETGELLYSIRTGGSVIIDGAISEDGKRLSLLDEEGLLWLIEDEMVSDVLRTPEDSNPQYLFMNKEGTYGGLLSLLDQRVTLFDVLPETTLRFLEGQVAGTSTKGRYALIYHEGTYEVYDTLEEKRVTELKHDYLPSFSEVLGDDNHFRLSDDGSLLSGLYRELDSNGNPIGGRLFVLDTTTDEVLQEVEAPRGSFSYGFSDDGKWLLYSVGFEQVNFLSVETGELTTLPVKKGFISGFRVSPDASKILVSYSEGTSLLYDVSSKESIHEYVGEGLKLEETEEGLQVTLLYNNLLTTYVGAELQEEVTLSAKRTEAGDDLSDRNLLDNNGNFLLTLKSRGSDHFIFLLDAHTGELLSRYELTNFAYRPKGFFKEEGDAFYLDFIFGSGTTKDGTYEAYQKMGIFPIKTYEALLKEQEERFGIGEDRDNN